MASTAKNLFTLTSNQHMTLFELRNLLKRFLTWAFQVCMFNWIRSFLCQRYAKVRYKSSTSKYVQMRNGLPQTAVINCFLFNIMINDQLKNSSVPLISNALLLQTILSSYQLIRTLMLKT